MKIIFSSKGLSLVEVLIVILVFSILGVLTTGSIFLTLRGTKKSQSIIKVRENLNLSLSVIQRQLRSAQKIVTCPNSDTKRIDYLDENGVASYFLCNVVGSSGYIASGSARLTSEEINVTSCSLTCSETTTSSPPSVDISISAEDALSSSLEKGRVTSVSKIFLRNY